MFDIQRYTPKYETAWNDFVARSRQGTFLFDRRYMDYHNDRFTDCSLMAFRKGRFAALLPANADGDTLYSHQGLTYGGLLTTQKATAEDIIEIFHCINDWLRAHGLRRVVYKCIPWIYHKMPAEEDLYALTNTCGARLSVRHLSSAIDLRQPVRFTESRLSGLRKARRAGVSVEESEDLPAFWDILTANLQGKYHARPVHSLAEMQLLKSRFPHDIRLLMATLDGMPVGGTLLYLTPRVVHTQYISASPKGKATGALDMLFDVLLHGCKWEQPYFDFGKSSDGDGHDLNVPLIFQKEGFGGRGVCYDWYEYEVRN